MDQISILAASGMRSSMQSLDLLANNIANASTSGYKGDSEFHTVYTSEAADADATEAPVSLPMIQRRYTDFSQGLLEPTNNPLDFGLSGKGFFVVKGPSGPLYTRNGNFRMSPDGTVVTSDGYPVLDQGGQPIKSSEPGMPLQVSPDGSVHQNGQHWPKCTWLISRSPVHSLSKETIITRTSAAKSQRMQPTLKSIRAKWKHRT